MYTSPTHSTPRRLLSPVKTCVCDPSSMVNVMTPCFLCAEEGEKCPDCGLVSHCKAHRKVSGNSKHSTVVQPPPSNLKTINFHFVSALMMTICWKPGASPILPLSTFHIGDFTQCWQDCYRNKVVDNSTILPFSILSTIYRDIPALSPILEDTALASGPKLRGSLICVECFAQIPTEAASILTCVKCGLPFCSEACRRTQRLHCVECRYVAKAQVGCKLVFFFLPFVQGNITIEELSSSVNGVLPAVTVIRLLVNSKSSNSVRLVDHLEDIERTEDWGIFQAVVSFIRDRCKIDEFTEEEILHALGVLSSNACNMAGFRARALFPVYSLINHSCAANARNIVNSEEGTVEVLAQRKIKKGDEICIRYVAPIETTYYHLSRIKTSGTAVNCWNQGINGERSCLLGDNKMLFSEL